MKEIQVTKEYAGGRLDKLLFHYLDRAPKGFLYKMLRKKNIVLNEKKAGGNELLKEGDCIRLYLAEETIAKFQSEKMPEKQSRSGPDAWEEDLKSRIVFEDENILAVNKPAGLLTQKAKESDRSLNEFVVTYLEAAKGSDALFKPGVSNRLDRNTTGLVLAGKNPAAARELNAAIRERRIQKFYLCLVKGKVEKEGVLDGYLVKDERTNTVSVEKEAGGGARILTRFRPVSFRDSLSLLEVELHTGKSHQIRAHLASIGHPIIGDGKYGDADLNAFYRAKYGVRRQLLHAERIVFCDMKEPLSGMNASAIEAPLPEDFDRIRKGEVLY